MFGLRQKDQYGGVSAIAVAAFVAAISFGADVEAQTGRTDLVIIPGGNDPGTWHVINSGISDTIRPIYYNVIEPLLVMTPEGDFEPGLAESFSVSDDGLTLTFQLREARFHNGDPVTADDVLFSLEAWKGSPVARSRQPFGVVDSMAKTDDRTVVITLTRPSRSFLRAMAERQGMVISAATYDTLAQRVVGTGPYVFDQYVQDSHLRLVRNPDYWGDAPEIETVTVRFIPDATAGISAMLAGEADAYLGMQPETYERITTMGLDRQFQVTAFDAGGLTGIMRLNRFRPPLSDIRLRQAVAHALDRDSIIAVFGADYAFNAACTYGTSADPWFAPESPESCVYPGPDRDRARALLAEANYDGTPVVFSYINTWAEAEVISAQLEAVGFNVQRDPLERSAFSTTVIGIIPPPTDINMTYTTGPMGAFATPDPNSTYTFNEEYNDLLQMAEAAATAEEYNELMARANRILQEDAVVITFTTRSHVGIMSNDLVGWEETFFGPGESRYNFPMVSWGN